MRKLRGHRGELVLLAIAIAIVLLRPIPSYGFASWFKSLFRGGKSAAKEAELVTAAKLAASKEVEALLAARKYDEALQCARKASSPALKKEIETLVEKRHFCDRIVDHVKADELYQAEMACAEMATAFGGSDTLVRIARNALGEQWDRWGKRVEALTSDGLTDGIDSRTGVSTVSDGTVPNRQHPDHLTDSIPPTQSSSQARRPFPRSQLGVLQTFDQVAPMKRISLVSGDVKRFAKDFFRGAQDPEKTLRSARALDTQLTKRWLDAPADRRIFLAGAGDDLEEVLRFKAVYERSGYEVFFYKFCVQPSGELCPSEVVGAFFSMAREALFFATNAAEQSRYLPSEVAAALSARGGQSMPMMVTPAEVAAAAAAGGTTVLVALIAADQPRK